MLGLSYANRLSPRIEKRLATLFTPSPSRVGHPGDPYIHVFGDQLGRSVEAYVDDIVVKTRKADDLVADLRIAFDCLRAKGVKLNPEKCVFGVPRGMLLGFIV